MPSIHSAWLTKSLWKPQLQSRCSLWCFSAATAFSPVPTSFTYRAFPSNYDLRCSVAQHFYLTVGFRPTSFQTFCSYLHQLEPACWHLTQLFIWQPNFLLTRAVARCSQILHCLLDINYHPWEHPSFLLSLLSPHPSMKLILEHYSLGYSVTNPLCVTFSLCHSGCTRAA